MPSRRRIAETPTLWRRILWLDQEIRNGTYPNVQRMQEVFECGRRTAFNTVCYLRDSLDAPIVYNRARGGYHYTDSTYGLPTVFIREGELFAVLLAEQVSRHYLGTPLEEPLRRAIEKLNQYLDDSVRIALSEVADRFRFFGGTGLDFSAELLGDLPVQRDGAGAVELDQHDILPIGCIQERRYRVNCQRARSNRQHDQQSKKTNYGILVGMPVPVY